MTWGWYWIPDDYEGFFDFLAKDKHLKVLQKQSAASYWNGDFVHRDHYTLAVDNGSYGKALEKFAQGRGWNVHVEVRNVEQLNYQETDGMCVEGLEETIVDCLKEWAFADAFAVWYENQKSVNWPRIMERYWERIPGTNIRIGQVLQFGANTIGQETGNNTHFYSRATVTDDFMKRQIEEAAEKVVLLG